ncbi:MAG: hypothetical protein ACRCU6_00100 [Fusobacteriaceae bacterium]
MKTNGVIITNRGLSLLNEAVANSAPLLFTTMKIGTGDITSIEHAKRLENLVIFFKNIGLTSITEQSDGNTKFRGAFTNENFQNETVVKEVGLFAKIGEHGQEYLFAYVNDGVGETFPAFSTGNIVEKIRDLVIGITDRAQVTTVLEKNIIYATIYDLEEQIEKHLQDELKILIGERYKGYEKKNLPGDVNFKNIYLAVGIEMPVGSHTNLYSEMMNEKCNILSQLRGEEEIGFKLNNHEETTIVGIELEAGVLLEKDNYTIGFSRELDFRIIQIEMKNTGETELISTMNEKINTDTRLNDIKIEYTPTHLETQTKLKSYSY